MDIIAEEFGLTLLMLLIGMGLLRLIFFMLNVVSSF